MPGLEVPRPTVRTLRTDAVAYVDPHFPVDRLWSPLAEPVHAVERGEDVELTGELVLVGEETVHTGHQVQGQHATYRFTGDEITAPEAARIGLILETVPDGELQNHVQELARRMARLPLSQLVMMKMLCNQVADNMGLNSTRTLGTLFDGIARHTQEGLDFVRRAEEIGYREAVRERDNPFGDYGSRPR